MTNLSVEAKERIRLSRIGKTHSPATKKKIGLKSLGRRHSQKSKDLIRAAASSIMKMKWSDPEFKKLRTASIPTSYPSRLGVMPKNLQTPGRFGNVVRGYFDIDGKKMFFRSKWEANYALYLNFLIRQKQIVRWEFEPQTFLFEKIRSGTRTYKPDFKVYKSDGSFEFHEVKGWLDPQSKTKLKRMKKYFPEIKLILVDGDSYKDIRKKLGRMLKFY